MERFQQDIELAGLIGEKKNAVIVMLCAVSARLSRPLNLSVQGSSSAGKNHLLGCVASFLPQTMKKFLTGMSPKTLMHAGKDEFKNKAIFIAEHEGVKGADYAIRTMQSEQVIEWDYVESSQNGIHKKTRRVEGPAAFIQATTRPLLHPENETRLLFVEMDESEGLTRDILARQAAEAAGLTVKPSKGLFQPWHEWIDSLTLTEVTVPFAKKLAGCLPVDRVRSRRDFPKLIALIQASAFLHQPQRMATGGAIVADARDYTLAKTLFKHCYGAGPDKAVATLVKAAESFGIATAFSIADLIPKTGWGKSKIYEVLGRAQDLGCVCEVGWGKYTFIRELNESLLKLPDTVPFD